MTMIPTLQTAQIRLAQHYLGKLRVAAEAVSRGGANLSYGLKLFEHEMPHIQHWQAHSVQYASVIDRWAQMCKEFPIAGSEVLAIRHTPTGRRDWWKAALEAARSLQDREAERVILSNLAKAFSGLGDLEKTEQCAYQLLELAHEAQDSLHIGKALYDLGTIFEDRGKHAEAASCYQQCQTIFDELGLDIDRGRALLGLGSIATVTGDYLAAFTYFQEYLGIVEIGGKVSDLCFALLAVSEALRYLKRYDEVEIFIQRSIQLCQTLDYQWALGPSLIAMGVCAMEQGKLESASEYLEKGVQVARDSGAQRDVIYGLSSLGYVYYRRECAGESIDLLQEALRLAGEAGMLYCTCYIERNLAYVYLDLNDLAAARDALVGSLTIARDLALRPDTIKALTCAVAYGHATGRHEQAAHWAGFLMDDPDVDLADFQPVCEGIEAALGTEHFREMLARGKRYATDDIINEVLALPSSKVT